MKRFTLLYCIFSVSLLGATEGTLTLFSSVNASATITLSSPSSVNSTASPSDSTSATNSATPFSSSSILTSPSSASSTSSQPWATPTDPATDQDVAIVQQRRLSNIVGALGGASSIPSWLTTLNSSGQWPDVDYTSGCPAQRANWPAETHWSRISTLAGAWHGGLSGAAQYAGDSSLRASISLAMGYWFANDFTNPACLDSGGTATCPCGTPGLWNTNWFPNIIGTPQPVVASCLLLNVQNATLLPTELANCTAISSRAYATFMHPANQVGVLTGANALDVAKIGIDLALLTANVTLLTDAYQRVHKEMVIELGVHADGIRPDGSFGQHSGILYNGNYGLSNDVLDLEVAAGGTQFEAAPAAQTAFATLFDGDRWMVYVNALTGVLHWDFSALGRFIAFPTADSIQPVASLDLNLTRINSLGNEWGSDTLVDFATKLSQKSTSANAGNLRGNRMFYDNDYMASLPSLVHRGADYVTTLKMYSSRSRNTECTNLANPFGFHLSDGALRTYLQGDEYEDIAAAMDWNRVPGITTDYGATSLNCAQTQFVGAEKFVGGASDGQRGIAAMRYTNPLTHNLNWQKTWFFLDNDVQLVMVANISSSTNATVITVLDQRRHRGPVFVDNETTIRASETPFARRHGVRTQALWHGNVGYSFSGSPPDVFSLSLEVGEKKGNWSAIGTSTQPPETVDLFSAWIVHDSLNASLAYTMFPGIGLNTFINKRSQLESRIRVIQNDAFISAVFDGRGPTVMVVFWAAGGGSADFAPGSPAAFTVSANGTAALMFDVDSGFLTLSDPTQTLAAISVTLTVGEGNMPPSRQSGGGLSRTVLFTMPSGGLSGSSVSQNVYQ
ncbi:polysaccharide lyase family 8 protein [Mycena crocata]|nr:polysaccharide lyase family 8 protein [Mycena crocata]